MNGNMNEINNSQMSNQLSSHYHNYHLKSTTKTALEIYLEKNDMNEYDSKMARKYLPAE